MSSVKATAPGKLILSGEHSVVYGAPALALAVDKQVVAQYGATNNPSLTISSDLFPSKALDLPDLSRLPESLDKRFQAYISGQFSIADVLGEDIDLLFYVYAQTAKDFAGEVSIHSELPLGAGMGSSAAVIAAVLKLSEFLADSESSADEFMNKVRFCERLQHGRGSVLDAAAVTFGGLVKVQSENVEPLSTLIGEGWYHLNTGTPRCTTGATVDYVRQSFSDSSIWSEFATITEKLSASLSDPQSVLESVRQNQRLLQAIGVVPESVKHIVQVIENMGGAAKISGAGAYCGDCGGQLLVYLPDGNRPQVESQLGMNLSLLKQSFQGARLVHDH